MPNSGSLPERKAGNAGQAAIPPGHCPCQIEEGFLTLAKDHGVHLTMPGKDGLKIMGCMGTAKDREAGRIDFFCQGGKTEGFEAVVGENGDAENGRALPSQQAFHLPPGSTGEIGKGACEAMFPQKGIEVPKSRGKQ